MSPAQASLVCDYAAGFACSDQLQYFRVAHLD